VGLRIRNIDPAFFSDADIGAMEPYTRLFFIGTWCLADWNGNLEENPREMKARIFPYDNVDPEVCIQTLLDAGMMKRYQVRGVSYLNIPQFHRYQIISGNERRWTKKRLNPKPSDSQVCESQTRNITSASIKSQSDEHEVSYLDIGHRTQDISSTSAREGEAGSPEIEQPAMSEPWAGYVRDFRACHEACRDVPVDQIVATIRNHAAGCPGLDVGEAIRAFGREWAGDWPRPPLGIFRRYLAWAARKADGIDGQAGAEPAGRTDPAPEAFRGRGWRKEFSKETGAGPAAVTGPAVPEGTGEREVQHA
jgi:hypothetical protein